MSIDPLTGDIYTADVGQETFEEVNFQPADSPGGENYGWNLMEGSICFSDPDCEQKPELVRPVAEYPHGAGCSISGGDVYRGNAYPAMKGVYFYGDYCSGMIWGLKREGLNWVSSELLDSSLSVSTFGLAEDGSIYVAGLGSGVYLLSDGDVAPEYEFEINAGLNDAWWDPETSGQGFFITVFPDGGTLFLAWFTYDTERPPDDIEAFLGEPGHRWLTAFGAIEGNIAVLEVETTSGGLFDQSPPGALTVPGRDDYHRVRRLQFCRDSL